MGRLDGKVAIVTGAGSGIGEATARLPSGSFERKKNPPIPAPA